VIGGILAADQIEHEVERVRVSTPQMPATQKMLLANFMASPITSSFIISSGLDILAAPILSPFQGFVIRRFYPGLAPWAAFSRPFAPTSND
jgi:hypothetical protein